jgi:hypothetical protein
LVGQFGVRRIRSPPFALAARLRIDSHLAGAQVIDRTRPLLGQEGEGLTLVRLML